MWPCKRYQCCVQWLPVCCAQQLATLPATVRGACVRPPPVCCGQLHRPCWPCLLPTVAGGPLQRHRDPGRDAALPEARPEQLCRHCLLGPASSERQRPCRPGARLRLGCGRGAPHMRGRPVWARQQRGCCAGAGGRMGMHACNKCMVDLSVAKRVSLWGAHVCMHAGADHAAHGMQAGSWTWSHCMHVKATFQNGAAHGG